MYSTKLSTPIRPLRAWPWRPMAGLPGTSRLAATAMLMESSMAFLPSLYVASEIHDQSELRVTDLHGDSIARIQAMAWRSSSPARALFRELAQEIREILRAQQPADIIVIDS